MNRKNPSSKKNRHEFISPPPYTFLRWNNGEFFLETCSSIFGKDDSAFNGVPTSMINIDELKLIRLLQANIFNEKLKRKTLELELQFNMALQNSSYKREFITKEIDKCNSILSKNHEDKIAVNHSDTISEKNRLVGTNEMNTKKCQSTYSAKDVIQRNQQSKIAKKTEIIFNREDKKQIISKKYYHLEKFDLTFEEYELQLIREYASEYLFKGNLMNSSFVHNPRFKYRNDSTEEYYILSQAIYDHLDYMKSILPNLGQSIMFNKIQNISAELRKYSFFELPKVSVLSRSNERKLIAYMCQSTYTVSIAAMYSLGFIDILDKVFPNNKTPMYCLIGKWFDADAKGENARKNISIIRSNKGSTRYSAYKSIPLFEKFYETLITV